MRSTVVPPCTVLVNLSGRFGKRGVGVLVAHSKLNRPSYSTPSVSAVAANAYKKYLFHFLIPIDRWTDTAAAAATTTLTTSEIVYGGPSILLSNQQLNFFCLLFPHFLRCVRGPPPFFLSYYTRKSVCPSSDLCFHTSVEKMVPIKVVVQWVVNKTEHDVSSLFVLSFSF
jgi:hypothetical protein